MAQKDNSKGLKGKKETIGQHKKSITVSSSKVKEKKSENFNKKIEKTGQKHDDWNDPTGNSHITEKNK